MNAVEQYYRSLGEIHRSRSAAPETSYYPALESLLNAVGSTLVPRVRCIIHLKNAGAGIPDGGMFSQDQITARPAAEEDSIQVPERGAIEVKPASADARTVIRTEQGHKYLLRYGLLLVTTLREFVLFERGSDGQPVEIEAYSLASDEVAFWLLMDQPKQAAARHAVLFPEFLRRVLTRKTHLTEPVDVAWFLASYARDARTIIEWKELATLAPVRSSLEEALGLKFVGEKGDHFFKSTLVQTLFYGLFAAWVLWSKQAGSTKSRPFDWRSAQYDLRIPMVRALFAQFANAEQLSHEDMQNLVAPLERATEALNRVERGAFFESFANNDAVQYFYEPFLEAFDPELRKSLGVWYTPPEIVRYMVTRVDAVLREEMGVADGLADRNVYVLDPCCGTGAFLLETLRCIGKTLAEKGGDALVAQDLKSAARERVFGFEIMPAPFVVSHLQLGLLLEQLGAPLSSSTHERVGVYLTNALTGWEPQTDESDVLFRELKAERDAAQDVKRNKPILVVLGNPPYNAFAGVSPAEEDDLVEPYKAGLVKEWRIRKFNLDDLYVRFFRIAEQRIVEKTGRGIVCFISNFSYLSEASFVVLRRRILSGFDKIWIDCLNGDSRESGKLTPDGEPDPSAFSTDHNPEGIRVGTAIGLFARLPHDDRSKKADARVVFRDFWGTRKRADLLDALTNRAPRFRYATATPEHANRFTLVPSKVSAAYRSWPRVVELAAIEPITGYKENRGFSLVDLSRETLAARMQSYLDGGTSWEELASLGTGLTRDAARFDARKARKALMAAEVFTENRLLRYVLRPLETRWCYYSQVRPLWNEPRPSLFTHRRAGHGSLVTRPAGVTRPEGVPFYFTKELADFDFIRGHSYHFPLHLSSNDAVLETPLFVAETAGGRSRPNLSARAQEYLTRARGDRPRAMDDASALWMHVLAIGYSPAYLREHADGIRQDWPRIPLPARLADLEASAELGRRIAALLDTESSVQTIDAGTPRAELRFLGSLARIDGRSIDPAAGHLDLDVGWGHAGKNGVTMPGKGKLVEREYTQQEREAIVAGAGELGLDAEQVLSALGPRTFDVFLNDSTFWRNVPVHVWQFVIGGYQVVKKWLSYREHDLLGRSLTPDEARYVTGMVRRLAAITLLQPALDESYKRCAASSYRWPTDENYSYSEPEH